MSYEAHIASKYQVDYVGSLDSDEFIELSGMLEERADELEIEYPCYAWKEDAWYEFRKEHLTQVRDKLSEEYEDDIRLKSFIGFLLDNSDPENDFVRVDVW